eukprot:352986-Chlamydomonas_euryale.AAC.17
MCRRGRRRCAAAPSAATVGKTTPTGPACRVKRTRYSLTLPSSAAPRHAHAASIDRTRRGQLKLSLGIGPAAHWRSVLSTQGACHMLCWWSNYVGRTFSNPQGTPHGSPAFLPIPTTPLLFRGAEHSPPVNANAWDFGFPPAVDVRDPEASHARLRSSWPGTLACMHALAWRPQLGCMLRVIFRVHQCDWPRHARGSKA